MHAHFPVSQALDTENADQPPTSPGSMGGVSVREHFVQASRMEQSKVGSIPIIRNTLSRSNALRNGIFLLDLSTRN